MRPLYLALFLVVFFIACCSEDTTEPPNPGNLTDDRVTITNDTTMLGTRVEHLEEEVVIEGETDGDGKADPWWWGFHIWLVSEIAPPTYEGVTLQANSVFIKGNFAVVGYNVAGATRLGAIDVFNITFKLFPRLKSSAIFTGSDVNSVSYHEGSILVAEATDDPDYEFPAVYEIFRLRGFHLILEGKARGPLTSYAGTCVQGGGIAAYATSGNTGGVTVLDLDTWEQTGYLELDDARWVDADDGKMVVVQGTPGRVAVYDEETLALQGSYPFPGADVAEAKSTVELLGGKLFVAAGSEGVQVLSATTGTILGSVPVPDAAELGLDPSVVATNAVSSDGELIFIANGEAGVYVAEGTEDFDESDSEEPLDLTLLGQLQFDSLQSANHIAYRNNVLVVAAGLGGVKILRVLY